MHTKNKLESELRVHPLVQPRIETLRVAEEIDPNFRNPHIVGGYLRNIILGKAPNDCDVAFEGYMLNQPGILEAVQEAEIRLGIEHYPEWEFENLSATGFSGNFYDDVIGKHSYHTDYLTMLLMDGKGVLYTGEEPQTLQHLEHRIYDLRFAGVSLWADHRGNGRSYSSCIIGDLMRGMYLTHALDLTPSKIAAFLFTQFDSIFNRLNPADQEARIAYWIKKTRLEPEYEGILKRYGIRLLSTKTN